MAEINVKLRAARLNKRWALKKAADQVVVSEGTFIRWEQGQQNPSLFNLDALCRTFGMSPEELGFGHLVSGDDVLNYKPRGSKRSSGNNKISNVQRC